MELQRGTLTLGRGSGTDGTDRTADFRRANVIGGVEARRKRHPPLSRRHRIRRGEDLAEPVRVYQRCECAVGGACVTAIPDCTSNHFRAGRDSAW